jgi:hypothetical protein
LRSNSEDRIKIKHYVGSIIPVLPIYKRIKHVETTKNAISASGLIIRVEADPVLALGFAVAVVATLVPDPETLLELPVLVVALLDPEAVLAGFETGLVKLPAIVAVMIGMPPLVNNGAVMVAEVGETRGPIGAILEVDDGTEVEEELKEKEDAVAASGPATPPLLLELKQLNSPGVPPPLATNWTLAHWYRNSGDGTLRSLPATCIAPSCPAHELGSGASCDQQKDPLM